MVSNDLQPKAAARKLQPHKTNTLLIKTPEGIVFSLLPAGPVTRFLAWLIDLTCVFAAIGMVSSVLEAFSLITADLAGAAYIVSYFILSIGYPITAEWYWRGQTVGKRLLRLRVMDEQGLQLRFSQIAIRNLLRPADSLPLFYLVGGIACFVNRRAQRLGDIAANTIVIRTPKIVQPDLDQLLSGKYNSLRQYPHLSARLRQRVSPQEARIALQALLRRDELYPRARVELFNEIATHFRSVVVFPQEATDGIPDEQYVRNVVDILFREKVN